MEKIFKNLSDCEQELVITFSKEELTPYYDAAFKKAQPSIEIKGFRKGKVPMNMVRKMFGREIEVEAEDNLINDTFRKIAIEDKVKMIGTPHLHEVKVEGDNKIFTVHYEVFPEFTISEYKGLVIDEPVHKVTDAEIDDQVALICEQSGTFTADDKVLNKKYLVKANITKLNNETKESDGTPVETIDLYLSDKNVHDDLSSLFIDKVVGDKFVYEQVIPNSSDNNNFEIEILEIKKLVPAEFNEELVKIVSENKFDNPDDLREEIGFSLQEMWDNRSRRTMENNLIEKLIDDNQGFSLPKSAIDTVSKAIFDDMVKKNQLPKDDKMFDLVKDQILPLAERNVRWEIIREKIIELEGITVEDYDIDQLIDNEIKDPNVNKEPIRAQVRQNHNLLESILAKKAMDFLFDFTTTNEVDFDGKDIEMNMEEELDEDLDEENND